ncbi:MAG TPA: YbhB/YbcL family Raf kinase inhibitor-like protein [Actinomycetota bacterium]
MLEGRIERRERQWGDLGGDDRPDVLKAGRSALSVCLLIAAAACSTGSTSQLPRVSQTDSIQLASPAFGAGSAIPTRYTCDGQDVSPPLSWTGGPPAEEYALIVTDPDARGGEFVHWIVYAIPASANSFEEDAIPGGAVEGTNGFSKSGYGGPCPPRGDPAHGYVFTVYGLRTAQGGSIPAGASLDQVLNVIRCCIQSKGMLVGSYGR